MNNYISIYLDRIDYTVNILRSYNIQMNGHHNIL